MENKRTEMNKTTKRIILIVVSLIISFILVGHDASAEAFEVHYTEVNYEERIFVDDVLDISKIAMTELNIASTIDSYTNSVNETAYVITHYTSECKGCTGITASGYNVKDTIYYDSYRIVAAPKSIPFYTIMEITYRDGTIIDAVVLDRGGAIRSNKLDLLVKDRNEAFRLGRQVVDVKIVN